ncbi:MAG: stage III sporulation protein AD [bacterium]
MGIINLVGVAIIGAILAAFIKQEKPEIAFVLTLVIGIIILISIINKVGVVIYLINDLAHRAQVNIAYINIILKVIAIAYIGQLGIAITRDCGEEALAMKVEMGVKVAIMIMVVPIMIELIDMVIELLP